MSMKYVATIAIVLAPFFLLAQENIEKPDAVLIHPGETLYVTHACTRRQRRRQNSPTDFHDGSIQGNPWNQPEGGKQIR